MRSTRGLRRFRSRAAASAVVVMVCFVGGLGCPRAGGGGAYAGQPAPALALPTLDGARAALAELRGKVVLVNFWATWCGPCALEMPTLEHVYEEFHDAGLEVLAVSVDAGGVADLREFTARRALRVPILLDPQANAMTRWGVAMLPTSFLIGRDGRIVRRDEGYRNWDEPRARSELLTALREGERPSATSAPTQAPAQ
ncbi:MAG: TlpA family protein disulfide reductase [Myxococcales bacterium]|nr:TlpA family protein disulfide reductase [Myxococcales bacterium]